MKKRTKQILMTGIGGLSMAAMAETAVAPLTLEPGQSLTVTCPSDEAVAQELAKLRHQLAETQKRLVRAERGVCGRAIDDVSDWWSRPSYGGLGS